jgi:four helix bundle protein
MASRNYSDLIVWQRAMDFVEAIYRATKGFPVDERYGLTSQMRRAAISIPSNIAEGQGRGGMVGMVRFLRIAYGSLREVETQVILAGRLSYLEASTERSLLDCASEIGRLLNGLMKSKSA